MKRDKQQQENQLERDKRLHEHAKEVNRNARMSIKKQGDLVHRHSQLSTAITMGFEMQWQHGHRSPERAPLVTAADMGVNDDANTTKKGP